MAYDFHVADHYFDREELLRRKQNKAAAEKYVVPIDTFWRPIEVAEYFVPNL